MRDTTNTQTDVDHAMDKAARLRARAGELDHLAYQLKLRSYRLKEMAREIEVRRELSPVLKAEIQRGSGYRPLPTTPAGCSPPQVLRSSATTSTYDLLPMRG